jgi:hypothetical protein
MKMYLCTNADDTSWLFYGVKPGWNGCRFIQHGGKYIGNSYTGPNRPKIGECIECELTSTPSDPESDLPPDEQIELLKGLIKNLEIERDTLTSTLQTERDQLEIERKIKKGYIKQLDALRAKLREIPNPVAELLDALELGSLSPGRRLSLIGQIRNHYGVISRFEVGYEYKVEDHDHWWRVIHVEPDNHFVAVHVATKNACTFDEKGNCKTYKNEPWKLSHTRRKSYEATT